MGRSLASFALKGFSWMFGNLTSRLNNVFDRLRGRGALSEADVIAAMREIRIALLEADVALPVVKEFIQAVQAKAIGQEILKSVTPGQQVVKIVHDHLIEVLGTVTSPINLSAVPPVSILMVGLQGSGKTTTTAKIARLLKTKFNKKILMVSLDVYRPAAREQLEILGRECEIETLPIVESEKPLEIAKRAQKKARVEGFDVVFFDTAGRLHIDDILMQELESIKSEIIPTEILLVADAMTGQDAVNVADTFNKRLGVTGIVLTRLDGDARGGAALSMRAITGCPIKLIGVGEALDKIEEFYPERIASRILDMGDVLSLVEKAADAISQEDAQKFAEKMQSGAFDLNDMADQLKQMQKIGGMSGIMGMLPGIGKMKDKINQAGLDDSLITHQVAIIQSMTQKERQLPKVLNASRRKRIAQGSGTSVQEVNRLMKQYLQMSTVMKQAGKLGEKGMKRQGLMSLFRR
jgi:signal recognition particle subunit SRP54